MPIETESDLAVEVSGLERHFQGKPALQAIDLSIPKGTIQGLVGLNGAGKTTLIRHLIGALKPECGQVSVLGKDPIKDPEGVLKQVGYMTEEDSLPKWMRVGEMINFCRAIYPTWDQRYATELMDMFSLSVGTKLNGLSKGQRARVGLLTAIAHRPLLLILDEPSSGLDPLARSDILEAIIRTISDEGRTVLFSSHLLDEVDRVCDQISLLHDGTILDTLKLQERESQYCELIYKMPDAWVAPPDNESYFGWRRIGEEWSVVTTNSDGESTPPFIEARLIQKIPVSLERWFEAKVTSASALKAPGTRSVGASANA